MGKLILLIEDDARLGEQIAARLRSEGFQVVWRTKGRLLDPRELDDVALVILDLLLPGSYGLDILRAVRGHTDTPFLILSARDDTHDKVQALRLGADDYMTKPFWPDELVERVRARLRRPAMHRGDTIQVGALSIDLAQHRVEVGAALLELTRVEFAFLAALARKPGVVRTRAWLTEHVLDTDGEATERALDAHVSRLRKKLGAAVKVETVWGIGYRLAAGDAR
ncbi:MAG TPA: response regulator transcription factor [Candidatus Polarisedimenticolia bacterium]|nr:response regulator transcription factor [Candidatus Polarisedimenticolia bacterium]